jgi:fatty acid desaturase
MRNWRDLQSLAYLILLPLLVIWQWHFGFSWWLFALELFLTLGVGVIHHNHAHVRIWNNKLLNRLTDLWVTLLQGHPTFVFHTAHVANHHRYRHGEKDIARTYRFFTPGAHGDSNHLLGYVLHPIQAAWFLYPLFIETLHRYFNQRKSYFYYCVSQYAIVLFAWLMLAFIDWKKWLVLVLLPQLHGLHWLLATNYLQHAHADGSADNVSTKNYNYARNFYGLLNPLLMNIGYHTAHHEHSRAHWSQLPLLNRAYKDKVAPQLQEPSLLGYMLRVYVLGIFSARLRTQTLHKRNGYADSL